MSASAKLKDLGIVLPEPKGPVGSYVAIKIVGNLLFISGQISIDENSNLINLFKNTHNDRKDLYNLNLWEKFEFDNPRIFAGMYQFWCQKAA